MSALIHQLEANQMDAQKEYFDFIAAIDDSVAGTDENHQTLSERVDGSAQLNAAQTVRENPDDDFEYLGLSSDPDVRIWEYALDTAKMLLDTWPEAFPELVK